MLALLLVIVLGALLAFVNEDVRKLDLHRLPTRAGWQLPDRVLQRLVLRAGDRVADLGAGDGYFVPFLADAVGPSGRVYAVEVGREEIAALQRQVAERGPENVEVVEGRAEDPLLPDGEIDLVLVVNVYHHISEQIPYFERLRGDLAPLGRVAILEPRARGLGRWFSPGGHYTAREELISNMEQAGYRPLGGFDDFPVQNLDIFRPVGQL